MSTDVLTVRSIPEFREQGVQVPGFVKKIQNVLTGRIFENWKETLLTLGTVYCVIKAAVSFFSGYWIAALCEISLGAFLAILRREIHDFTNLHLANRNLQAANHNYRLANARHTALLKEFEGKLNQMEAENTRFDRNNTTYEAHLGTMGMMMNRVAKELTSAREQGRAVSQDILDKALKQFDTERQSLKLLQTSIVTANKGHQEQVEKLLLDAQKMNTSLFAEIGAATRTLEQINGDLTSKKEDIKALKGQITRLSAVRDELETVVRELRVASKSNTAAAEAVSNAADKMSFLMKLKNSDIQRVGGMIATVGILYVILRIAKAVFPAAIQAA